MARLGNKKGVRWPNLYAVSIAKNARLSGTRYKSVQGKSFPGKNAPRVLFCKCHLKCPKKFDEGEVKQLFDVFQSFDSKAGQDVYLQGCIQAKPVKRCRVPTVHQEEDDSNDSDNRDNFGDYSEDETQQNERSPFKRSHTFAYTVKKNGAPIEVCQSVFLQIHAITQKRLRTARNFLLANKIPVDNRGGMNQPKIDAEIVALIRDHIEMFAVKQSHYSGVVKKYLDARLTITKMHEMFILQYPHLKEQVKYKFYYDYKFGRPQVDVCGQCEQFNVKLKDPTLTEDDRKKVVAVQLIHKCRAKKFYNALKEAEKGEDKDTVVLAFNYMSNLLLPHIPVQDIFYMRQLWVNTFCIHDVKNKTAKLCVYHEGQAKKSLDEVCSFLHDYVQHEVDASAKKLILFSDATSGQNRNHTLVQFLLNKCDSGKFEDIIHYFPVREHSFLPCDRDLGSIKCYIKKFDRIYTPDEYHDHISDSSGTTNRLSIHKVKTDEVLSFKRWWSESYKQSVISDETCGKQTPKEGKVHFKISTYKEFRSSHQTRGKVVVSEEIGSTTRSTFSLLKSSTSPPLPQSKAYPHHKVPINSKKLNDLRKLMQYLEEHTEFYEEILQRSTTDKDSDDSECED